MTTYHQKAKDGMNWVQILVVAVAANLLGGLVFTLTENLMPGWVVYPVLLIYLPFTLLGQASSVCADCSRPLLWVTLFIIPLITAFVAIMAWRQGRHHEFK